MTVNVARHRVRSPSAGTDDLGVLPVLVDDPCPSAWHVDGEVMWWPTREVAQW